MTRTLIWSCVLCLGTQAAAVDAISCAGIPVSVSASSSDLRQRTCQSAQQAYKLLRECNVIITDPVKIEVVKALPKNCMGLYHCGEDRIEILQPDTTGALRKPDSVFAEIPTERFFDSIVAHELSHAAFDKIPCNTGICPATAEYVAYTMQIRSLILAGHKDLGARTNLNKKIENDEINAIFLMMAPNRFIQKAWTHLSHQEDACTYIGQVMSGKIRFDFEAP